MAIQTGLAVACTGEAVKCVLQQSVTHASVITMLSFTMYPYMTKGFEEVLGVKICSIRVPTGTIKGCQRVNVLQSAIQTLHKTWAGECRRA